MEPGAFIELQNIHFPWKSENPSSHESNPEQHSYNLVAGAKKLGIDLRADENFESWLNEAGFINYKEKTFAWCTYYPGQNKSKKMVSELISYNLRSGLDAYGKGFLVHGLGWSSERVELLLVDVRQQLKDNSNPVWVSASVCYAQKPVP
jgi:hypothetical protein